MTPIDLQLCWASQISNCSEIIKASHFKIKKALSAISSSLGTARCQQTFSSIYRRTRLVTYLSKKLDPVATGWPSCLHIIESIALLVKDADKLTLYLLYNPTCHWRGSHTTSYIRLFTQQVEGSLKGLSLGYEHDSESLYSCVVGLSVQDPEAGKQGLELCSGGTFCKGDSLGDSENGLFWYCSFINHEVVWEPHEGWNQVCRDWHNLGDCFIIRHFSSEGWTDSCNINPQRGKGKMVKHLHRQPLCGLPWFTCMGPSTRREASSEQKAEPSR